MQGQLHTILSLLTGTRALKSATYSAATRAFSAAAGQIEAQLAAQGSPDGTPTQSESTLHELSNWLAERLQESAASPVAPAPRPSTPASSQ
jgi:hypothetical protein